MSIFNSLGSNYDFKFAIRHLFSLDDKKYKENLINFLEKKYSGRATLVYKGREAIRLALRSSGLKGGHVAICGFTCYAVYDAIVKEGFNPVYLDIKNDDLNFSYKTLVEAYKKNSDLKIIMIQNTLGSPCEMENIANFCNENNIILIEDLAHSIGTKYKNEIEAGKVGDFVILSFSQDKMIDGVAGGALIIRNSKYKIANFNLKEVDSAQQFKDRFYPLFTYKIRNTYNLGVGKLLHWLLKKSDLLSKPVDDNDSQAIHNLPNWYCKSIYKEFSRVEKNLNHRIRIVQIYVETLDKKILSKAINGNIEYSSNLRFPIFLDNRKSLINYFQRENIYISDIWNDAPIAPRKYLQKTDYKMGECPNSEIISEKILNLPTHRNVTEKGAKYIADKVNLWMKLQ